MKTKLLTIAMTAALMLTAMTKVQAQNFDGPCLPPAHGLVDHQSAFCSIMQAIALSAGPNWFSTYLDITLEDLQAALAAATPSKAITIKSQGANSIYAPRTHSWNTPASFTWDVAKMYYIVMAEACEITLEGMPIDPVAHPITITGGGVPTWIGFPFSESKTLLDAFTGFAVNADVVKSSSGNSVFSRGNWNGGVSLLEPGKGYIYISAPNSQNRVLTYPTSSK